MEASKVKIVMIEDDEELAEILKEFLGNHNMELTNYAKPMEGLEAVLNIPYDVLLLDLTLPEIDGLELCKIISSKKEIPIIISSARSSAKDKIDAIDYGAEDYLPKPYDPKELLERIQGALRRYINPQRLERIEIEFKNSEQQRLVREALEEYYKADREKLELIKRHTGALNLEMYAKIKSKSAFHVDATHSTVIFHGKNLNLTKGEYEIVALLASEVGKIFSRQDIVDNCPSFTKDTANHKSIDVIISRIRSKMDDVLQGHSKRSSRDFIISVRGLGYRLELPEELDPITDQLL